MENEVKVNLLEMITLNEITFKYRKGQMDIADSFLSLFKRLSQLNPDTPLEELEEMQSQLRAMMNNVEEKLKIIQNDKEFVKKIMERANKITSPSEK